jgi:hypothetical protein
VLWAKPLQRALIAQKISKALAEALKALDFSNPLCFVPTLRWYAQQVHIEGECNLGIGEAYKNTPYPWNTCLQQTYSPCD